MDASIQRCTSEARGGTRLFTGRAGVGVCVGAALRAARIGCGDDRPDRVKPGMRPSPSGARDPGSWGASWARRGGTPRAGGARGARVELRWSVAYGVESRPG